MHHLNRFKVILIVFFYFCFGCFTLLSCSTMNTADKVTDQNNKSFTKVLPLSEFSKGSNTTASDKTTISPEKEAVNDNNNPQKGKIALADQEFVSPKNESNHAKQISKIDNHIRETEMFAEYSGDDESSSAITDKDYSDNLEIKNDEEKDVMEEALLLLDESQQHWTKGEIDDALQILDQAYVLLMDANGNSEIARQKDDLRLMIAKKILAIYNSSRTSTKGIRSEIPIISNSDVEKEIRSFQTRERDFFIASYQRSMIYRPAISRELKKAGLPDELSWLPLVESGFKINALSSARALGLWQFIPSTGYKYGLNRDYWIDERLDFEKSTKAAIAYLKELHSLFGDWLTALAGYNCGEGRIMRTIAAQHINYLDNFWDLYQRLPNETARYVPRFLATLLIVKNPLKYGFDFASENKDYRLPAYEIVETNRPMHLRDVASKLGISETMIFLLNAELRYKITPNKAYKLKVPQGNRDKLLQLAAEIPAAQMPALSYKTVKRIFIKHRVRRGETLGTIANKYKTSVNAICSANKLSRKKLLHAGRILKIPVNKKVYARAKIKTPRKKISFYKAKRGDTLSAISHKYNISIEEIKKVNNLKSDKIKAGQILKITSAGSIMKTASVKYKVKKGDNLYLIAKKNGISLRKLLSLNEMSIHENIYPGQEIIVN